MLAWSLESHPKSWGPWIVVPAPTQAGWATPTHSNTL